MSFNSLIEGSDMPTLSDPVRLGNVEAPNRTPVTCARNRRDHGGAMLVPRTKSSWSKAFWTKWRISREGIRSITDGVSLPERLSVGTTRRRLAAAGAYRCTRTSIPMPRIVVASVVPTGEIAFRRISMKFDSEILLAANRTG
jgi:hypothetical protein